MISNHDGPTIEGHRLLRNWPNTELWFEKVFLHQTLVGCAYPHLREHSWLAEDKIYQYSQNQRYAICDFFLY